MKRILTALASLGLVATTLTACAPASSIIPNTVLNVGQSAFATNLNSSVAASTEAMASNAYLRELTSSGFYTTSANGQISENLEFGTAEIIKNTATAFTVKYQLEPGVKWSDSEPVTAADLLLSWAAGANVAGVDFQSTKRNSGLKAATSLPVIDSKKQSLTVTYDHPVADWQTAIGLTAPAHLVGKTAFGTSSTNNDEASNKVVEIIQAANKADVKLLASAFSKTFALSETPLAEDLLYSSGSYKVESATASAIVLKANGNCTWCKAPRVETVNLKFYKSPAELMAAVVAGDVDVAETLDTAGLPLSSAIDQIEGAKDSGLQYTSAPSGNIEALVINYGPGSYFKAVNVKDPKKKFAKFRDALIMSFPRQRFVDTISNPIKMTRSDSFVYLSNQNQYQAVTQSNGSVNLRIQEGEKASELAGNLALRKDLIRILFNSEDFRESIAFNMVYTYAASTGAPVVNGGSPDVAGWLRGGKYDAYLGQIPVLSSSLEALGSLQSNTSTLPSEKLNSLISKIANNPQAKDLSATLAEIDKTLFDEKFGVPIYEIPKLIVFSAKLKNYSQPYGASSAVSNFETWTVAPETKK